MSQIVRTIVAMSLVFTLYGQQPRTDASDSPALATELEALKKQVAEQQKQIDELRRILRVQAVVQDQTPLPVNERHPAALGEVASTAPVIPATSAVAPLLASPMQREPQPAQQPSPLSFQIGSAYFTPVGFMDFTAVYRDVAAGSGIGTNFGSFPYRTPTAVNGHLSESRLSPQNSRIGMRVDALVKGAHVIGYWESDFLGGVGNPPVGNVSVSSNSYPLRLRLFWADLRKNKFEVLAGQTWSLITPARKGISPLPGDLFYTQDIDVNYNLGLTWGRIPELRFVYHPSDKLAVAFALDNAEQYIGGSGGGGTVVLPANLSTAYGTELNNGTTTLGVPNLHPDLIAKIAFDPSSRLHFEINGVARTFRVYNPTSFRHFSATGGGVSANLGVELIKGLRFFTNNYWSDGGGRYIFGQAPDAVVRGDGSVSLVHSASELAGFELTHKNTVLYTYYGGLWVGKNAIVDPANGKYVGYGYPGSSNAQNRNIHEFTVGFTQTFWKDAKYGALALMGQYAYFTRNPWNVAAGTPRNTHMNEVFVNLRYTLPGSAPTVGK